MNLFLRNVLASTLALSALVAGAATASTGATDESPAGGATPSAEERVEFRATAKKDRQAVIAARKVIRAHVRQQGRAPEPREARALLRAQKAAVRVRYVKVAARRWCLVPKSLVSAHFVAPHPTHISWWYDSATGKTFRSSIDDARVRPGACKAAVRAIPTVQQIQESFEPDAVPLV